MPNRVPPAGCALWGLRTGASNAFSAVAAKVLAAVAPPIVVVLLDPVDPAQVARIRRPRASASDQTDGRTSRRARPAKVVRRPADGSGTRNDSYFTPRMPAADGLVAAVLEQILQAGPELAGSPGLADGDHAAEAGVLGQLRRKQQRCGAGKRPAGGCLPCWSSTGSRQRPSSPWRRWGSGRRSGSRRTAVAIALVSPVPVSSRVPGVELAWPAPHPEQDAGHLPLPKLIGMDGHQLGEARLAKPAEPRPTVGRAADHPLAVHRHLQDVRLEHGTKLREVVNTMGWVRCNAVG